MKRIFTILCALAIVMAGSATAMAAEPEAGQSASYYPLSVEEYTYGPLDELRVNKTYQLSLSDDPSLIPTEDFVRNGRRYFLLDMTRKDEVGVDIQTHTETITQANDTNSLEAILQKLDAEMEVTTEDGYVGVLRLDHTSVQVTTDGYTTKTSTLTASRSYPNLSEGRYSPIWPDGKKHPRNIYAHSEEECEKLLADMIVEMKTEIAAERERLKAG
jgi:hypothetical protein